jgi:hypothetical protein
VERLYKDTREKITKTDITEAKMKHMQKIKVRSDADLVLI